MTQNMVPFVQDVIFKAADFFHQKSLINLFLYELFNNLAVGISSYYEYHLEKPWSDWSDYCFQLSLISIGRLCIKHTCHLVLDIYLVCGCHAAYLP